MKITNENATAPPARRNKAGRRFRITPEVRALLLRAAEKGIPFSLALKTVNIGYQTLCDYRHRFPAFAAELEAAELRGMEKRLEKIVIDAALRRASRRRRRAQGLLLVSGAPLPGIFRQIPYRNIGRERRAGASAVLSSRQKTSAGCRG